LSQPKQIEHLFRHEYGKLVALLARRVGIQNLEAIEDAVQWSLAQALEFWRKGEVPDNPTGWLYQVAYRQLLSEFRSSQRQNNLLAEQLILLDEQAVEPTEVPLSGEMSDSLLRMLFVACNEAIPIESQLVFTLKSLCGFSIREIALRLFITEANAYKRFNRAQKYLKKGPIELESLAKIDMQKRLPSIHHIVYLLFTEGYLSSHSDKAIRRELCEEAIRLGLMLADNSLSNVAETNALLALMYFHFARIETRQDREGVLLLLEQQDRSLWNKQLIEMGMLYLQQSTNTDSISRYHIEAGIAAEHCLSKSFELTPWQNIVTAYQLLEKVAPSPLHLLNRAIATAEWQGPKSGLAVLESNVIPTWIDRSYHWYAVQSDLHFRCGHTDSGRDYAELALNAAPTKSIRHLLTKRLLKT
jgi:RNA polymerase sigma-70 factor (ECF subfamily)